MQTLMVDVVAGIVDAAWWRYEFIKVFALPYNRRQAFVSHFYPGAAMDSYMDLVDVRASATEIRWHLVEGERASMAIRIPEPLRDASKEETTRRGMSFSAFVHACMIEVLEKKGA